MNRRDLIKSLTLGAAGGAAGWLGKSDAISAEPNPATGKTLPPLKITKVRAIQTAPQRTRLVVVKVETSEPGLYGLGCATFNQRSAAVVAAVEQHLRPLLIGRNPANITDLTRMLHFSGYWRSGPVLN